MPMPLEQVAPDSVAIAVSTLTDAGIKAENEDAVGCRVPDDYLLITKGAVVAVADGVSSAEAGREASATCIRTLMSEYFTTPDTWSVKTSIQKLLTSLNLRLFNLGRDNPNISRGYITTLSLMVLKSSTGHLFHIGDSRIYRLRGADLEQLTRDHSAPVDKNKYYLTRAMGMDVHLNVDYTTVDLQQGDTYLLTTDGIHDFLSADQIRALLQAHSDDGAMACRDLVSQARGLGSDDNLSCALIHIDRLALENVDDLSERLTKLPFPPELEIGTHIDGYEVLGELYASERSQLYRVRELASGRQLAMKTPSHNYADDLGYIERFILEEWIGSRIDHPNVVAVVPPQGQRRFLYYLMELVPGVTLAEWMREHREPRPSVAIALVEKICNGLQAIHARETVHCDLKPGNVMVTPALDIKLVDFGSVYTPGVSEIFSPIAPHGVLGTADYADPQYRLGRNPGIQGDIFSLGIIVYEMFTGHCPYGSRLARCERPKDFESLKYTPSYLHREIVPLWFDGALRKATAIDPAQRYTSLQAFMGDLLHPNPVFLKDHSDPAGDANPLVFWRILSFSLMAVVVVLLTLLLAV